MAEARRGSDGSSGLPATLIFGKYELGRLLGCGAFAKVYHARDIQTGHSVAIKVINKKKIVGSSLVSNVKREISVMHRLKHPRIVNLHEVLATKTKIFFVMEFVKGGELFGKVAKGRFSEDLSRRFFQQLISAIGYCHMRGVFHRDLKPENLLVDENGDLKVSDFGLSAVTGQIHNDGLLHTLCGTPAYVAPEIIAKMGYDGARADVWSAGVVLFVLVAGYLPFNDSNLMAMYKKIYRGEFKCPRWISPDLKRLFKRILDTNPDTRITVNEILNDPWFQKGYQEMKFHEESLKTPNDDVENKAKPLNAFDIISCSSGLNLSGLFVDDGEPPSDVDRVVSRGAPERISETISELCENENLKLKKKKMGLAIEGPTGTWGIVFEIFPLTGDLVMVEIRRNGGGAGAYEDALKNRIKPELVARISRNSGVDFQ